MSLTLMYLSSDYIVSYIKAHPVDWCDEDKALARRGGAGDSAGITPTPAIGEFLNLLSSKRELFTQHDYTIYCRKLWHDWWQRLTVDQERGVVAKLFRNFYPSMIDSLHVWALFCEAKWFDICLIDSYDDAIGKTDLTLRSGQDTIKLAILGPTRQAEKDREYKLIYRSNGTGVDVVEIQLALSRSQYPGNKRWFKLSDFEEINPTREIQMEMAL